ncbi:hypothetical protein DEJ48_38825 [Streptomyces venezuelae]|uniref:Uncharacterized protein n=1 Tax=Streptomyces venezuelae TaxID=54571 RepID=A0A5P2C7A7_STRVZ|nr:hypothetical protein DEJ48_38825 [Streptomyces venezuelae]
MGSGLQVLEGRARVGVLQGRLREKLHAAAAHWIWPPATAGVQRSPGASWKSPGADGGDGAGRRSGGGRGGYLQNRSGASRSVQPLVQCPQRTGPVGCRASSWLITASVMWSSVGLAVS